MTLSNAQNYDAELAAHKEHLKRILELGEAVERLKDNPDFKVFRDYYVTEGTTRLTNMLASAKDPEMIVRDLQARGIFSQVLDRLVPELVANAAGQLEEIDNPEAYSDELAEEYY